jgi:hypothetical protein
MNFHVSKISGGKRYSTWGYFNGADDILRRINVGPVKAGDVRHAFDAAAVSGEPERVEIRESDENGAPSLALRIEVWR